MTMLAAQRCDEASQGRPLKDKESQRRRRQHRGDEAGRLDKPGTTPQGEPEEEGSVRRAGPPLTTMAR